MSGVLLIGMEQKITTTAGFQLIYEWFHLKSTFESDENMAEDAAIVWLAVCSCGTMNKTGIWCGTGTFKHHELNSFCSSMLKSEPWSEKKYSWCMNIDRNTMWGLKIEIFACFLIIKPASAFSVGPPHFFFTGVSLHFLFLVHLHEMTCFLFDRNPLWTLSNVT